MTDTKKPNGKRSKVVVIAAAAITAATPGVYGAWQAAKSAWQAKTEQQVSDKTTTDLQTWAAAARVKLEALEKTCVTHRELVDFALKLNQAPAATCRHGYELRSGRCVRLRVVATAPPTRTPPPAPKPPSKLLKALKAKAAAGSKVKAQAKAAGKLPTLDKPAAIRAQLKANGL
jgi:hypothetical protein